MLKTDIQALIEKSAQKLHVRCKSELRGGLQSLKYTMAGRLLDERQKHLKSPQVQELMMLTYYFFPSQIGSSFKTSLHMGGNVRKKRKEGKGSLRGSLWLGDFCFVNNSFQAKLFCPACMICHIVLVTQHHVFGSTHLLYNNQNINFTQWERHKPWNMLTNISRGANTLTKQTFH